MAMDTGGSAYKQLQKTMEKQANPVSNTPTSSAVQNSINTGLATTQSANAPAAASARGLGLGGILGGIIGGIGSIISGGGGSKPSGGSSNSGGGSSNSGGGSSSGGGGSSGSGNTSVNYYYNGQKLTGYVDGNGHTYTANGQRVPVGSIVQTNNGNYQMTENGGVRYDGSLPSGGGYNGNLGAGNGTAEKPVTVRYFDPNGREQIGYLINGQTYANQAGTQRVGQGSLVQTGGGWFQMGANGGVQVDAPKQITYEDEYGDKRVGYIVGDKTYTDPLGLNRIGNGSVVTINGQKFMMTNGGGVAVTDEELQRNKMKDFFSQQAASSENLLRQQAQAGANQLRQQLPGIDSQYNNLAQQAYINFMQGQQSMPEQMAKMGLAGQGTSESTASALNTNYQSNLNESELARRSAIQQVNNDIANLMAGAEVDIAKSKIDIEQMQFNAYQQLMAQMQQQNQWQSSLDWEKEKWSQGNQIAASDAEYERKFAMAQLMAQYGDFSGFKALGIDTTQAEKIWKEQYSADMYSQYAKGRSGGSSGGGKSTSGGGKIAYSKAYDMVMNSDNPAETLRQMGATYDITSTDYNNLQKAVDGMFESDFNDVSTGKITYAQLRNTPEGQALVNRWWKLYGQQYQELVQAAYEATGRRS